MNYLELVQIVGQIIKVVLFVKMDIIKQMMEDHVQNVIQVVKHVLIKTPV